MSLPRLRRLRKCPLCKGDGCAQGQRAILCWRIQSDRQAKSGAWIHADPNADQKPTSYFRRPDLIADIDHRHAVFSALLDALPLSGKHADHLNQVRGLSDSTILRAQFASVPHRFDATKITEQLAKDFNLRHVPGFFFNVRDRWQLRLYELDGFYIPLRDPQGRIQALQIRQDTNEKKRRYIMLSTPPDQFRDGASSGAPIHYVHPEREGAAIIIEGGLKAEICGEHSPYVYIGLVAVGSFRDRIGWDIRECLPGCKGMAIAYDADQRQNPKVAMQAYRLRDALESAGFSAPIIRWPAEKGNGLDDYLLVGNSL